MTEVFTVPSPAGSTFPSLQEQSDPVPGALPGNKEGEISGNGLGSLVVLPPHDAGKENASGVSADSVFL